MSSNQSKPVSRLPGVTLYGRKREQLRLRELLAATLAGNGGLVLIGGEAGIGKTSLVEDLEAEAVENHFSVWTGRSYDNSIAPPYGPWLEILDASGGSPEHSLLGPESPTTDVAVPEILYRQLFNFFKQQADQQPLLIVLDDAHWADHASLNLMRFLGRHLHSVPILIVATFQTEEMVGRHPLYSMLPLLVRESNAYQIDLRRLDQEAVRSWAHQQYALEVEPEDRLADYLEQHAEGNPFFISETLRTVEEAQILRQVDGSWKLGDLDDAQTSLLVRQTVEARLDRVSEEIRELLSVAAVIGQDVQLDLWGQVSGASSETVLEATSEAVEAWLLMATPDGTRVVFRHSLVRRAIYDRILPPHRRLLHQQVAETLTRQETPEPGQVAYHLQQTGDIRAVEWLEQAGSNAWLSWDWQAAAERFEAAIALIEEQDRRSTDRGWLLIRLAECHRYNSPADALVCIRTAGQIAKENDDLALGAMTLWVKGRIGVSSDEHGLPDLEAAIAIMNDLSDAERERIQRRAGINIEQSRAVLAVWRAISGRYPEAIEASEAYLSLPGDRRTPLIDAEALLAQGIAWGALGKPEQSRESFDAALEIYVRMEDHLSIGHTVFLYLLEEVLPYEADNLAKRDHISKLGSNSWKLATEQSISPARIISPPVFTLDGHWDEVRDIVSRTLGLASYARLWTLPYGMMIARFQGDSQRVQAFQQLGLPHDFNYRESRVWLSIILAQLQVIALQALDDEDMIAADDWINRYDQLLNVSGRVTGKVDGFLLRARFHRLGGDLEQARIVAEAALELSGQPWQPLSRLTAHRILGEIFIQLGQMTCAEEHLQRAAALAQRCNVKHEQILVVAGQAGLAIAAADHDQAVKLIDQARQESQQLGAMLLTDRIDALDDRLKSALSAIHYPAGLTEREVDVLLLIIEGHTDAEIAETLHISTRTVTNHVTSILRKTDSKSRAAAAAFAVRNGIA